MKLRHIPFALATVVSAGAVRPSFAGTIYDSGGFEPAKFVTGALDGQDNGLWIESGGAAAGTATVVNTAAFTGTQAVSVTRTASAANGGDKRYWPSLPVVTPAATPQGLITVSWDMEVAANTTAGVATGPFFGVEAYDPNVNLIAAAGVDATTGEILFADPAFGGGFDNTAADATVPLSAWNHFTLTMNFATDTATVSVNGKLQQVVPSFDSAGVTQFSDADLSTVATALEPTTEAGSALFDNYVVTTAAVPEPAGLVAVAGVAAAAVTRRSRTRPRPLSA